MKRFLCFVLSLVMIIAAVPAFSVDTWAAAANVITEKNPAVVIRTSFATCGYSDNWGGVHTAVPIKDKAGYVLYDVIIWEDRINLYKFPNNVESNAEKGFDFSVDVSTPSGLKKYVKWRESFCLKSIPCENTDNISKCSSAMKDAYIQFFKIVNKKTPSKNVILKYSGHGSLGFCGCMNVEDTKTTLAKGVSIFGQKFALIDFGTNCRSSNTDYLNVYNAYTNYMLGSQYDYGGYAMDKWDYEIYKQYDVDYQYSNMFKVGESVEVAAKRIINTSAKYWKYCKNNIVAGEHEQSMTLFDMREYDSFMSEFAKLYAKVNGYSKDAYVLIKKYGNDKLKELYNDFVIYYKDNNNSNYFKWDSKAYGLTAYDMIYSVSLSYTSCTYNGKVRKPSVTVKLTNGRVLTEGTDYTVSYQSGSKNVGKYKVTVSVKGRYGSKIYRYFTVNPKKVSTKSITAVDDGFKLKWTAAASQTTGYQIQYSTSSSFSSNKTVWLKDADYTSKTVKNLKSKKTYYVRIRAYKKLADGTKYYSSWSTLKVKTK